MDWNRLVTWSLSGNLQGRQSKVFVPKKHLNSRIADEGLILLGKKPIRFLGRSMSVKTIEHRFHRHEWALMTFICSLCEFMKFSRAAKATGSRPARKYNPRKRPEEDCHKCRKYREDNNWQVDVRSFCSCCFLLRHFVYRSACCVGGVTTQNAWRSGRKPP